MVIVEKLAAHLQVQLPADCFSTLGDVLRLHRHIFLAVETDLVHHFSTMPFASIACDNTRATKQR